MEGSLKSNAVAIALRAETPVAQRRMGLAATIWRRRRVFSGVFCAVFSSAVVALLVLPVRYLATGSVMVAEQDLGAANVSAAWAHKIGDPADLESQLLVIRSPRVMRLAVAEPGVLDAVLHECRHVSVGVLSGSDGACERLTPDSDALIEYIQNRYLVGSVGRSRVINISYQSPLPETARIAANALVTAFLADQRSTISTGREVAAAWLWQEVKQLDADVRDEDAKIQAYRSAKGLMRGATAPISSERLTSVGQQLSAAEAARADAAARLQEIKASQTRGAGATDAPAVLASRSIADLKQQITAVNAQLANLSTVLGPAHPSLRALQRERDTMRGRYSEEVTSIAASAQKSYDAADALVASLRQQLDAIKAEVAAATADEAAIESMVRGVALKRQQYAELYKRASELETERRVLLGSTRLVSLAELPVKPFFPKRIPFLAAGLTFAFMLAGAAAFARDRADRSVRIASDVTSLAWVPASVNLPQVAPRGASLEGALQEALSEPALQNGLRKLCANLLPAAGHRELRTLLVTSPGLREGKTFTALALAQFAAAAGRRVLVVDCDSHNAAIAGALDLRNEPGWSAVARGFVHAADAVVSTGIPNLDAIPAGAPLAAAAEFSMSKRLPELLLWARDYDLVILDGPVAEDAALVAKHVEGVLICARWGSTRAADAAAAVAGIRQSGGDVIAIAVTMADRRESRLFEAAAPASHTQAGAD